MTFISELDCPNLLVSYEKALISPGDCVDAVMRFCGIPQSEGVRE
ncbi:MAG TPA: hypothetical protein VKB76_04785 [Ktedonobacterales bacterium]|nr:hypothetical protein [Ktedonobacterales bacterium]